MDKVLTESSNAAAASSLKIEELERDCENSIHQAILDIQKCAHQVLSYTDKFVTSLANFKGANASKPDQEKTANAHMVKFKATLREYTNIATNITKELSILAYEFKQKFPVGTPISTPSTRKRSRAQFELVDMAEDIDQAQDSRLCAETSAATASRLAMPKRIGSQKVQFLTSTNSSAGQSRHSDSNDSSHVLQPLGEAINCIQLEYLPHSSMHSSKFKKRLENCTYQRNRHTSVLKDPISVLNNPTSVSNDSGAMCEITKTTSLCKLVRSMLQPVLGQQGGNVRLQISNPNSASASSPGRVRF